MSRWPRAFAVLGALAGGTGVALAALAAHATGPGNLDTASRFLLAHAPALLALAALLGRRLVARGIGIAAGLCLALGLVLFCGDLTWRALVGTGPLRLAAPAGGLLLIAGWAVLALAAIVGDRGTPERD